MKHKHRREHLMSGAAFRRSLWMASLYFLLGAFWILVTEAVVVRQVGMFTVVSAINIIKGLLYVLITASLLCLLIYGDFKKLYHANEQLRVKSAMLLEAQRLAHTGSCCYHVQTGLVDCTAELLAMLHIPQESFGGRLSELSERLMPQDGEAFARAMLNPDDRMPELICRTLPSVGEERILKIRTQGVWDGGGRLLRCNATVHNSTEAYRAEEEIKRERDRAKMYLDIATVLILVLDGEGKVTLINRAGCQTLGCDPNAIVGQNWVDRFVAPESRASARRMLQLSPPAGEEAGTVRQGSILTASGEERLILWRTAVLRGETGKPAGVLASGVDITELIKASEALHESERSKAMLLSNLPGMAFRCGFEYGWPMQFLSEGCLALTGYRQEALLEDAGMRYGQLIPEDYREPLWQANLLTIRRNEALKFEYEIVTASGLRKWVLQTSRGVYNALGGVEAIEGIVLDIHESKQRSLRIRYLDEHDTLTDLYNRRYFNNTRASFEKEDARPLALLLMDINSLKLINDAYGYEAGDRMIRNAAAILAACCRPGDLLARTGGDEFSLLAPCTGPSDAAALLASIRDALDNRNAMLEDQSQMISLSIALGVWEDEGTGLAEVFQRTEDALARQKLLEKKSHHNAILTSIMATMYERSFETEAHAERIARLSQRIGQRMGLSQDQLDRLRLFSMLHDIGKIGIHDRILKKPDKLTDDEWVEMKKHPEIGSRIAQSTPELTVVADLILTHHERWDGHGYPKGLAGEEIPLLSRILSVADAFDAMTENRVYHQGISEEEAETEIRSNAGSQFDPDVVDIFREVLREMRQEVASRKTGHRDEPKDD